MTGENIGRISISVVIPVYNERKTLREIIRQVKSVELEKEIILIDDCSTDGTRSILKELESDPDIRVFYQSQNQGKGAAIRRGFELATKDVVVVQDADLEYDPSDYHVLLRPIIRGKADVVFGSRFLHGERRVLYFWHSVGNRLLTLLSNIFSDLNLTDMETCYKVFKREIIQNIILESNRFGFEPEITAKVARLGCTIYEVPISYYGRSYAEGKKITWKDGLAAFRHILHFSLSRKPFVKNWTAVRQVMVNPPVESDVGVDTLEAFENAPRYNGWIFERMRQHVGKRVLEVGAGIGNIVAEVLKDPTVERVIATDIADTSLAVLRDRLGEDARVSTCVWNAENTLPDLLVPGSFDTIICSNVLEHIEDHRKALMAMRELLAPQGKLILLVPAHQAIFSGLDEDLGHFRRYSRESLGEVLGSAGFNVQQMFDHNFVGAVGWWWTGKMRGRRKLRQKDTKTFEKLVPFLKPIDKILCAPWGGVSLIAISTPQPGLATPYTGIENSRIQVVANG